ncbi:MAG: hypothetical protein WD489_02060 [Rhodovibrionaceae bacterium]
MRDPRTLIFSLAMLPFCLLAGASQALAQQSVQDASQEVSEQFAQFVISQPYAQTLMQLIAAEEAKQGIKNCSDQGSFNRVSLWILEQLRFDSESGPPTGGKWQDRLSVEHCGRTMIYNFLISAQEDGTPQIATLLPGDSNTDPQLQRETLQLAIQTASEEAAEEDPTLASCADVWVKYAEFDAALAEGDPAITEGASGGWTETWEVDVCDRMVPLEMTFLLFDQGKRAKATAAPVY